MPKLEILSGKREGSVVELPEGQAFDIGNRKSAQLTIRDPWISYNHARIQGESGRFFIEDLGSSNGTWVNGEKIKRFELQPGTLIYLGKTKVKFLTLDGAPSAEAPASAGEAGKSGKPWWDKVIDGSEGAPTKARMGRLEQELRDERGMRVALERFLELPKGAKAGDAAKAGALEDEVAQLKTKLEGLSGTGEVEDLRKTLEEERARGEKQRREHMSKVVELEGKVTQSESKSVELEGRLKDKAEQAKKESERASEKADAELAEARAALEEAREAASGLAAGGDEALAAERERGDKLERELEEWRTKARESEEQVEGLKTELGEAQSAAQAHAESAEAQATDGAPSEELKAQLEAALAEASKWREEHETVVREIDEISMEQMEIEEELTAKVERLTERLKEVDPDWLKANTSAD